ncbi:sirohydrochlorin cobaltochelatase [Geofilum sp. OHC36d9]|uniref:sirohydrochlorin cobaltochelatase n=1 Tax=Geofilum sp. OHC36d9 TaxID=3458413 RepID=UPI0040345CD9
MANTQNTQTGILLVSFGTSYANARIAFNNIEKQVKIAFPDTEIRWAFSSAFIRKKLKSSGIQINSPEEALVKMANDGFQKIAVQSLHIIPGEEYEKLHQSVTMFNQLPDYPIIKLAPPLLYSHADLEQFSQGIHEIITPDDKKNEAFVFMGHGTNHTSNIYYPGLQYYLNQQSSQYILGTIEGYPGLPEVMTRLAKKNIKEIKLMPLMSVAGDHAQNDMAGPQPDSWKSILEKEGYQVTLSMHGLAEYNQIVAIWINHLNKIMDELEK